MFRLAILILCQVGGFFVDIQAPSPETPLPGPLSVVLAPDWYQAIEPCSATRFISQTVSPSFQRSAVVESHWKSNSSSDGYTGHVISVALYVRKFERKACYPLSALCSALDGWNASFKSARADSVSFESFPSVGSSFRYPAQRKRLVSGYSDSRGGAVDQVPSQLCSQTKIQFQPRKETQGQRQRQDQREPVSLAESSTSRRGSVGRPSCGHADVPGSSLVNVAASPDSEQQHAPRSQSGCSFCSGFCCREQAEVHVCVAGEVSGGIAPGYSERDEGGKAQRRRGCNQIPSQAGE